MNDKPAEPRTRQTAIDLVAQVIRNGTKQLSVIWGDKTEGVQTDTATGLDPTTTATTIIDTLVTDGYMKSGYMK